MTCPSEIQLIRFVAGDLSAEQAETVARHVAECPRCAAACEAERSVWAVLGKWPEDEPTGDLWPTIRATCVLERRRGRWLPRTTSGVLQAVASIAIAVGLGWATGSWLGSHEHSPARTAAEPSIEDVVRPLGLDEFATSSATGLQFTFEADDADSQEDVPS